MITIQKKYIIITLITFIIAIGLYLFISDSDKPIIKEQPNILEESQTEQNKEEEEENDESKTDNVKEENKSGEPVTEQFRDLIVDVVNDTIKFFFKKNVHIVAIGDSLTQGVGDASEEGGYIGILDKTVNTEDNNVTFENLGKRGNRTDQLLKRLEDPKIASSVKKADVILITIGANDIMQVAKENFTNLTFNIFMEEEDNFKQRLDRIFLRMRELNGDASIYLLGLYNPFEKYFGDIEELDAIVDNWNMTEESVTEEHENITFIPIKDLFDNAEMNLLADDNFHPNKLGYHRMAERVLDYLTEQEGDHHGEAEETN